MSKLRYSAELKDEPDNQMEVVQGPSVRRISINKDLRQTIFSMSGTDSGGTGVKQSRVLSPKSALFKLSPGAKDIMELKAQNMLMMDQAATLQPEANKAFYTMKIIDMPTLTAAIHRETDSYIGARDLLGHKRGRRPFTSHVKSKSATGVT